MPEVITTLRDRMTTSATLSAEHLARNRQQGVPFLRRGFAANVCRSGYVSALRDLSIRG